MGKKYCIDTSSLISMARYFTPFDDEKIIYNFLKTNFEKEEFILLESVLSESKDAADGLAFSVYPFLNSIPSEESIVPNEEHHAKLDASWPVPEKKDRLNEKEFRRRKGGYTKSADFQLIAFCMGEKDSRILITEETPISNDGKLFEKIPTICTLESIQCHNLVWLLREFNFSAKYSFGH